MTDPETCRQHILSEDYWDFIGNHVRTAFLDSLIQKNPCEQDAGFEYKCFYLPSELTGPISLSKFSYDSIPKCFSPTSMESLNQAGILPVQNYPTLQLRGKGTLIGFLDSGIDYTSEVFRNIDGSTRIVSIWDQTVQSGTPPDGFFYGTEFTGRQISDALASDDPLSAVPSYDDTGHGTYCASLAAGSGNPSGQFLGAAPEASIAVVKLKQAKQYLREYYFIPEDAVCYQENDLMLGLKYLNDLADSLNLPLVVCITVGSSMGGHIGTLPLSYLIDGYSSAKSGHITVVGVGNEADKRHHFSGTITDMSDKKTVEIRVGDDVAGFCLELWTDIPNILSVSILSPSGENSSRIPFRSDAGTETEFLFERTKVYTDYRLLVEKSTSELIFFRFDAPAAGIWKIIIEPLTLADGTFHMWLPVTEFLSGEVFFLEPDPYYTLTNPASADSPVVVSYFNGNTGAVSQSSGRGYTRSRKINPDIAAPGTDIQGAFPGGRFSSGTGASAAASIAAGAVALMLEWLLYYENAPGIDSFQIKSLLILGATRPDTMEYPNREWGYGKLNLYNTFETLRRL